MAPRISTALAWLAVAALAAASVVTSAVAPGSALAAAAKPVTASGYLDFRKPNYLIVDGQRIQTTTKTKFSGGGAAKSIATIPLGYEIKVVGTRQADGTLLASSIEAKPNTVGSTEKQVLASTDEAEQTWVKAGKIVETDSQGKEQSLGDLKTTGPEVDRARRVIDRVAPSYIDPKSIRVYVVVNPEWNAMAMANFSIYVFDGLMKDMDDDELAIVLGHELTHAAYEHSRRQAAKSQWTGLAGAVAGLGAAQIKNGTVRQVATVAAGVGVGTFNNCYSREFEDQADRVGLRYVYESGYDYTKAPALWQRFAAKYGDQSPIENFFFGNHSTSLKRAAALSTEIKNNYKDPSKDPPTKAKVPATSKPATTTSTKTSTGTTK